MTHYRLSERLKNRGIFKEFAFISVKHLKKLI